jgi:6-phosphogluconate dehydrogenase
VTGIAEATFARSLSGHADQRAAAADALPGPDVTEPVADRESFVDDVRKALYASKVVAYAQGFDMIRAGADEYGWTIDLGAISSIWRGGCIIRAQFLNRIREAYDRRPFLPSLLVDDYFRDAVAEGQAGWRRVVADATRRGIPVPGFSSALSYYDAIRAQRLPAALVQGQRDLFGAHTYRRVDRDGSFHVDWSGDETERPAP